MTFVYTRDTGIPKILEDSEVKAFSGADVNIVAFVPTLRASESALLELGSIQTLSISSTRSVSPVRVLGRSAPISYNRGARTWAGSLVFASLNKDPFNSIVSAHQAESLANVSTAFTADQMPPFTVIITATTEVGETGIQILKDVTLVNYGTTYSINDLYIERVYTYVATNATPFILNREFNKLKESVKNKILYAPDNARDLIINPEEVNEVLNSQSFNQGTTLSSANAEKYPFINSSTLIEQLQKDQVGSFKSPARKTYLERLRKISEIEEDN